MAPRQQWDVRIREMKSRNIGIVKAATREEAVRKAAAKFKIPQEKLKHVRVASDTGGKQI